jgi:hypothetical protein
MEHNKLVMFGMLAVLSLSALVFAGCDNETKTTAGGIGVLRLGLW